MKKNKLVKINDTWCILNDENTNIPIHEQHSFWLKMFANENQEINYITENGFAILKSDGTNKQEYPQD